MNKLTRWGSGSSWRRHQRVDSASSCSNSNCSNCSNWGGCPLTVGPLTVGPLTVGPLTAGPLATGACGCAAGTGRWTKPRSCHPRSPLSRPSCQLINQSISYYSLFIISLLFFHLNKKKKKLFFNVFIFIF